jgi:hypothetical protein
MKATLNHEALNNAMECAALIAESLLAGAEGAEVFSCLWNSITCMNLSMQLASSCLQDNDDSTPIVYGTEVHARQPAVVSLRAGPPAISVVIDSP